MIVCRCCGIEKLEKWFRERKNKSGKIYRISTCIFCERQQKSAIERKRYLLLSNAEKEEFNKRCREYRRTEKYKIWHRNWQKERENYDIAFRLKRRVSTLIRNSLNKNGLRFQEVLGYSPENLRIHLENLFEPWMNWNNWGIYNPKTWDDNDSNTWTWQIDHIIPIDRFKYKSITDNDFRICWSLENLRPLSAKENLIKGSKLIS